ncbi:MAG: RNA polymerase sigma factor, partial [Lachnospiraceae bacterium]|nr:RNA polymerase sigma factor [Lachnospiraceae bacterium]
MIDELYDSLYKELTGWCTAMTGSRTLAEDLVQEAFLRALINAGLLEELDAAKRRAWMYRTVKNLYIDRKRREAFETMVEQL